MIKKTLFLLLCCLPGLYCSAQIRQFTLPRIREMADLPQPLQVIDWTKMALAFDSTVYDLKAGGRYWPLVWIDSTGKNFNQPVLGMYTAMGDVRQGPANHRGMFHEALATMGGVLGASLNGINKSSQHGLNYVGMLKNYFNRDTGWDIMMNNTAPEVALLGGGYGRDWWYDVYPNLLFYAISDLYPEQPGFTWISRRIAEKFLQADSLLQGNYNYSYFDYGKMVPVRTAICPQPDAAAGHAYVLYAAYQKFGDQRYLKGAVSAMKALESQQTNPTYELLMPFGAYLAARMNAEQGTRFDVEKLLHWTFDGTAVCREGWGVLTGRWNGMDISGTVGSTADHGGYAFLMNTLDAAWPLVPMVRYQPAYADMIGKWMLNAVNASRLFYPAYIPAGHQTLPEAAAFTKGVIAYEGFARSSTFDTLYRGLSAPVAQGDGPKWVPGKNPQVSQFSVYGSAHAGIFGGIVKKTSVEGILQLDLLATDFYREKSCPAYLYYNPYPVEKTITCETGITGKQDWYDLVSQRFIRRGVTGKSSLTIGPLQSKVLVLVPSGAKTEIKNHRLLAGGIVIDYHK